jgi:hypothetical protein
MIKLTLVNEQTSARVVLPADPVERQPVCLEQPANSCG